MSETRANIPNGNNADGPVVSAGPVGVFAVVHRTQSLPLTRRGLVGGYEG